jgi:septum formation protein
LRFSVQISGVQELSGHGWTARELCVLNADLKAQDVSTTFPDDVVLGADTVVSLEDRIFGKPKDMEEARIMIESLSGRVHEVLTGVSLIHRNANRVCRFYESTRVKFRPADEIDIDAYLLSIHPLDKAGAYAAQEDEGRIIECVEGLISNVIGLPVERVMDALRLHFPETLAHLAV